MLKVFLSKTFNPYFNLATEDWIFRDLGPNQRVLFLWRNQETVVIGRFQNPWKECNLQKMEEDKVFLSRRQSGGGAVFHDLGNTNFTFMSGRDLYSKKNNNQIMCSAFKKFGIDLSPSGRNDLVINLEDGPRKVSGSAFKENKDRCFHHGTLLLNADLKRLGNYLTPTEKKLKSKGIASVRSRVANLSQFNPDLKHEVICPKIVEEFETFYGEKAEIIELDHENLKTIGPLNKYYEQLKDWSWCYGETPKFEHELSERFDWGNIDVHINSKNGMIKEVKLFSDSLHPEMIELLGEKLKDVAYTPVAVAQAVEKVCKELPMIESYLQEFKEWIIKEIR